MRLLLLFFLLLTLLEAKSTPAFVKDFQNADYNEVCTNGLKHYYGGRKNEMFVAMVGTACAYIDNINPLGMLQRNLVSTPDARETASYFATLVLQKRLLYQFMLDDLELGQLALPYSNHILSLVIANVVDKNYKVLSQAPKMIKISDGSKNIIISISDDTPRRVLVDVYEGSTLTKRHWFQ